MGSGQGNQSFQLWSYISKMPPLESQSMPDQDGLVTIDTHFSHKSAMNRSKTWVVDVEPPLDNPDRVIDYVGRYTHRVAISNSRILDLSDGKVAFSYKNRQKGTVEAMRIDAVEFIRRFLLHTLPKGLMRIRYYGFLANRCKGECLKKCRKSLGVSEAPVLAEPKTVREIMM